MVATGQWDFILGKKRVRREQGMVGWRDKGQEEEWRKDFRYQGQESRACIPSVLEQ